MVLNDTTALFSGNPLKGLVAGRGDLHADRRTTTRPTCGSGFRRDHKHTIREKKLRVYYCDMVQIAREVASEADLQMRMQGIVLLGAFLQAHAVRPATAT